MGTKPTLIEFRWVGDQKDDPLDYLGYATLNDAQIAEVKALLQLAERQDRIHAEWYVGPFADGPQDGERFLEELEEALMLEVFEEDEWTRCMNRTSSARTSPS